MQPACPLQIVHLCQIDHKGRHGLPSNAQARETSVQSSCKTLAVKQVSIIQCACLKARVRSGLVLGATENLVEKCSSGFLLNVATEFDATISEGRRFQMDATRAAKQCMRLCCVNRWRATLNGYPCNPGLEGSLVNGFTGRSC